MSIRRTGIRRLGVVAAALLVAALHARAGDDEAEAPVDWAARAKQAWGKTCKRCHTAPDRRFETDRIFLRQIMETT